jgi:hypothetical protein
LQDLEEDEDGMIENHMEIVPLGPESLELNSFMQDGNSSGDSINEETEDSDVEVVHAISVQPSNFLPLEINPDELMGSPPQPALVDHNEELQQQYVTLLEAVIPNPQPEQENANVPLLGAEPSPDQVPLLTCLKI